MGGGEARRPELSYVNQRSTYPGRLLPCVRQAPATCGLAILSGSQPHTHTHPQVSHGLGHHVQRIESEDIDLDAFCLIREDFEVSYLGNRITIESASFVRTPRSWSHSRPPPPRPQFESLGIPVHDRPAMRLVVDKIKSLQPVRDNTSVVWGRANFNHAHLVSAQADTGA